MTRRFLLVIQHLAQLTAILISSQSTVLELIKKNMVDQAADSKGFLIDGYPREVQQGIEFENTVISPNRYRVQLTAMR